MAVKPYTGWTTLDASGIAARGVCQVWGFIVKTGSTNEQAIVYEGLDTTSGRLFATLYCSPKGSSLFTFPKPVRFERGVYIDFTGNIDEVTVLWEPVD